MKTILQVTVLATLLGTSGCGPEISREELGEVIFTLPKVPTPPAATEPAHPTPEAPGA